MARRGVKADSARRYSPASSAFGSSIPSAFYTSASIDGFAVSYSRNSIECL
jgi:hypothetical protein